MLIQLKVLDLNYWRICVSISAFFKKDVVIFFACVYIFVFIEKEVQNWCKTMVQEIIQDKSTSFILKT